MLYDNAIPLSLSALFPIVLAPVNLGKVFVVPVPVTGLVKVFCLLLKVVQSALESAPRLVALAVGTFKVITGVVVLLATVELKSVPVVPIVKAATDVTEPVP